MLVSLICQMFGLICLSLAMDKHFKSAFNTPLTYQAKIFLKCLGWIAIVLSGYFLVMFAQPLTIAIVKWLGGFSANVVLVALIYCRLALKNK